MRSLLRTIPSDDNDGFDIHRLQLAYCLF
jgi:hypothetical protein